MADGAENNQSTLFELQLRTAKDYFQLANGYFQRAKETLGLDDLKASLETLSVFFNAVDGFNIPVFDADFYDRMTDNLLGLHFYLSRCRLEKEAELSFTLAKKCLLKTIKNS